MWGKCGLVDEAQRVFNRIGQPSIVAFSAMSLIQEAENIFNEIPYEKRIESVYTSMIDCFARSFQYMTMLSSARNKKDAVLAQQLFDRIRLLFSDEKQILSSATVVLANTYGFSGNLARTSDLRTRMAESGLKKVPGRSSTVANGEIVHFYANESVLWTHSERLAIAFQLIQNPKPSFIEIIQQSN
ncbi:unnamed protein product [Adineta ricciae]|uniref:Uncharacterized protein n=1 Tax=Adineta ricciae TaxID=249248 RepID=A0A814UEK7_ADIRI|nr:unnamed protein product [Adineta ricciae]